MATGGAQASQSSKAALTLLALGVVFGDIGTSPLYAMKETFAPSHGMPLYAENILGGLSTIFWALMMVVSLKYVVLIMRADNRGEGGIMALLALATTAIKDHPHWRTPLLLIGVFGASLFYGDAVLTPAISVLSAVEGLEVGTSAFKPYVVPIAVVVIVALFLFQARGTAVVGRLLAPSRWCGSSRSARRASTAFSSIRACSSRSARCMRSVFSPATPQSPLWCWAPWCWR